MSCQIASDQWSATHKWGSTPHGPTCHTSKGLLVSTCWKACLPRGQVAQMARGSHLEGSEDDTETSREKTWLA